MTTRSELEQQVEERAASRCEYCRMHQSLQGATFHVEHILPKSRGGVTELSNLAWACPGCNLHKSDRTEIPDPDTGALVPVFNPRVQAWHDHFCFEDYQIIGMTTLGRALVAAFRLNDKRRIRIRQAEQLFALFPPE